MSSTSLLVSTRSSVDALFNSNSSSAFVMSRIPCGELTPAFRGQKRPPRRPAGAVLKTRTGRRVGRRNGRQGRTGRRPIVRNSRVGAAAHAGSPIHPETASSILILKSNSIYLMRRAPIRASKHPRFNRIPISRHAGRGRKARQINGRLIGCFAERQGNGRQAMPSSSRPVVRRNNLGPSPRSLLCREVQANVIRGMSVRAKLHE